MATSSKRTYITWHGSQVCCSQSPCPHSRPLLTHASAGDTQALKGRSGSVSCGVPGAHRFSLSSLSVSEGMGSILNTILPLLLSCWGFSFVLGCQISFSGGKEMATHSSILAWKIPWTEESGRLLYPWGSQRVRQD